MPDVFERQAALRLTLPESVTIVGVGGVGSWLAYFLALAGVRTLHLWDGDEVSETNLNRLPLGPTYVGESKSGAMRTFLGQLVPRCHVLSYDNWAADLQSHVETPQWIVAATDTWQSRKDIFKWAQRGGHEPHTVNYLEVSAEGEFGGVTGEPATFATPEEDQVGYASVPVHVGPCVGAAMVALYHIVHNKQLGRASIQLGWRDSSFSFVTLD